MASRLASESKPTLTMPRKRLPLASPTSIRRVWPASEHLDRLLGVVGDAEDAGEVVAAPAGDDPERRLGAGHRAADRADQPVAAHHHRHLAGLDRPQRLLDPVLEALGALHAEVDPARVERLLDPRQQLQRLAAGRGGVDQQRQRHSLDFHRFAAYWTAPLSSPPRSRPTREAAVAGLAGLAPARTRGARSLRAQQPSAPIRAGCAGAARRRGSGARRGAAPGRSRRRRAARRSGRRGRRSRRGRGARAASPTLKATRPSGSSPTLAVARGSPRSERSTPRTRARGNSRARNSAASPSPQPISRTRSGSPTCRAAAASGVSGGADRRHRNARSSIVL